MIGTRYKREIEGTPWSEYFDGEHWISERDVCHRCEEQQEAAGKPYRWADERYSFGVYAGRYCESCWSDSGYRDATDPEAKWSPADCGEVMEPEDY